MRGHGINFKLQVKHKDMFRKSFRVGEMRRYEREKIKNFFFVIKSYFISSAVTWIFFFLLFWFFLYDSKYGKISSFSVFYSPSFFLETAFVWLGCLLFSAFMGMLLCAPIIIIKIFLHYKLQSRLRQGPKPFFLFGIEKYLPIIVFLLVHFGFLLVNISLDPSLTKRFLNPGNLLYRLTSSVHYSLFHSEDKKMQSDWARVGEKGLLNQGSYFFFVPAAELKNPRAYVKTKSQLQNVASILLTNPSKQAAVASLLHIYNETNPKLFVPEPLDFQISMLQNEKSQIDPEHIFIGINSSSSAVFSWTFPNIEISSHLNPTWFSVFMNRMAMAMPEYMLLFRMGFGSFFHTAWGWENINNHNEQLLKNYSKRFLQKTTPTQYAIFFLAEQEKETERGLISIQKYHKTNEKEDKSDSALSSAIAGILSRPGARVVVLPYAEKGETIRAENMYSNFVASDKSFLIYESIIPSAQEDPKHFCHFKNMGLSFSNKNKIESIDSLDALKQRPDGKTYFNSAAAFLVQDAFKFFFVCFKEGETPVFLVQKKDVLPTNAQTHSAPDSNLIGALFSNHEYRPGVKPKTSDFYITDEKDTDADSFFKSFLIFSDIPFERPFSDREKENFVKENGNVLMNELYSTIHLQLR